MKETGTQCEERTINASQLFEEAKDGGLNIIHVTIAYWENKKEVIANIEMWNQHFKNHSDLIMPIRNCDDIQTAMDTSKIGIIFGFQNCSPIEDDIQLIQEMHDLGARIMQLSYNNQNFHLNEDQKNHVNEFLIDQAKC